MFMKNENDIIEAIQTVKHFGKVSRLDLNITTTVGKLLGKINVENSDFSQEYIFRKISW